MSTTSSASCIFCKIIQGTIPCKKILETTHCLSFLDIGPLSKGHALVIPKVHAEFLHQVPQDYLPDLMITIQKVAKAIGAEQYNILQNNGTLAHQQVPHVHFHVIPKPSEETGLKIGWPIQQYPEEEFKEELERIKSQI